MMRIFSRPIILMNHLRVCYLQKFMNYSLTERGRAEENVHFLKIQREQLENIRRKILNKQQQIDNTKDRVNKKIDRLVKTDPEKKSTEPQKEQHNID